jgi:hypothetical protein
MMTQRFLECLMCLALAFALSVGNAQAQSMPGNSSFPSSLAQSGVLAKLLTQTGAGVSASIPKECADASPLFELRGPTVNPSFWSDPRAAGETLVLQGEIMIEMGKVLVRLGALQSEHARASTNIRQKASPEIAELSKIGPRLSIYLHNLDAPEGSIDVLILIANELTPELTKRLESTGFKTKGVAGNTISGTILVSKVVELAHLSEVRYLEIDSPLRLDPPTLEADPIKP